MDIFVTPAAMQSRGVLKMGDLSAPCALGSGGMAAAKSEGDGTTPIGAWPVRRIWYRPDREARPITALQISQISRKSSLSFAIINGLTRAFGIACLRSKRTGQAHNCDEVL